MKLLLVSMFALLTGINANASYPTEDSSWNEISKNFRVIYQMPQIQMGNWFIRMNQVCIEGDMLRSARALPKCVEYGGRDDNNCVKEVKEFVFKKISGTAPKCTKWRNAGDGDRECVQYVDAPYTIKTTFPVNVYRKLSGNDNRDDFEESSRYRPLFTKMYSVPACGSTK